MDVLETILAQRNETMLRGIRARAQHDRSDPFALARGLAHLVSGACSWTADHGKQNDYGLPAEGPGYYEGSSRP